MVFSRSALLGAAHGVARRRAPVAALILIQILVASGFGVADASTIQLFPRGKAKVAKTASRKSARTTGGKTSQQAKAALPAPNARAMRSAEGAIVNIIDSYIDRKNTGKSRHVYLGKIPVTFYWTVDEADEGKGHKGTTITIARQDGTRRRVRVSDAFKRRLDVEGTAMLADGHVLNVSSRGGIYDDVTSEKLLGVGTQGKGLVPFRSIAVNSSMGMKGLKFGDRVFIPQAVGMRLPTGGKHDGYFRVDDVGSGVRGIDIYALTRADSEAFERVLKNDQHPLPMYKVLAGKPASSAKKLTIAELD